MRSMRFETLSGGIGCKASSVVCKGATGVLPSEDMHRSLRKRRSASLSIRQIGRLLNEH